MKRISMILILTLMAFTAVAAPGRGRGPKQQGPNEILSPPLLAEFLGLTEAQIEQIQPLRETQRAMVEPLREQQKANQEQIRAAVAAGNAAEAGQLLVANHGIAQQIKA